MKKILYCIVMLNISLFAGREFVIDFDPQITMIELGRRLTQVCTQLQCTHLNADEKIKWYSAFDAVYGEFKQKEKMLRPFFCLESKKETYNNFVKLLVKCKRIYGRERNAH